MLNLLRYTVDLFAPEPARIEPLAPAPPAQRLSDALPPANFRHPRANRESHLGHATVAFEFKRGKRRTIGFVVGPDGLVASEQGVVFRMAQCNQHDKFFRTV